MSFWELFVQAAVLSIDAFSVSVCKGLSVKKAGLRESALCGAWFGGFQGLMPLAGYYLGTLFANAIDSFDHWVAFGLLAVIGLNMLKEAFSKGCDCDDNNADFSMKAMFVMAVATSIDAMAVGVSFAMRPNVQIFLAVALIGAITFVLSGIGVRIGHFVGNRFEKKAQIAGGVILILLGLKILLEDLGVL